MAITAPPSRGFTLIEVLIALSITFLSATALFAGYRTALDSSARATASMHTSDQRMLVRSIIRTALLQQQRSGEIRLGEIEYQWEVIEQTRMETVLGFDAEQLQTRFSGRHIEHFDIALTSHQGQLLNHFGILLPAS